MFNSKNFSRDLKIQKLNYKSGEPINHELIKTHLSALSKFKLSSLKSDAAKKHFWINTYNGMTNHIVIDLKVKKSMKDIPGVYKKKHIEIDNIPFALDDIEHGILRRNAKKHLAEDDQILKLQVDKLDHRIHFTLNCGAQSCPMIAFYTAENIEEELNMAELSFVTGQFEINSVTKEVHCSPLFEWYKVDFDKRFIYNPMIADYKVILNGYNWDI